MSNIIDWLKGALAMEQQAEKRFLGEADRLKAYPALSAKLQNEAIFIQANQTLLLAVLRQLGMDTSIVKNPFGNITGFEQNITGAVMVGGPVRGIPALYTFTQMAISSYETLIATTDAASISNVMIACETILGTLERRASWIEEELDAVARTFLATQAA